VFEKTGQLHLGDVAYIKTTNGHIFKYLFSGNFSIAYNDTSIFDKLSGKPGLYLMTCDGVWNQFRRISTFTLESES
jgi:sortase (surface protein transpeptidase)